MSLSVTRYIEVLREQYQDSVYKNDMKYIGKWKDNDIVMVYTGDVHFYKITFPYKMTFPRMFFGEIEYIPITDITYDKDDERIVYHCTHFSKLPKYQLPLYDNIIYKTINNQKPEFYKYNNGKWILIKKCPKQWELVNYISEKNEQTFNIITGCNNFVRNNICYNKWNENTLANRGLPNNLNPTILNNISKYDFGLTNVLLSELKDERNKLIDNIKHIVTDYCSKFAINDVNDKLLLLLNHFNIEYNKDNSNNIECFDEDFEDALYMLLDANDEIQLISGFVNKYFKNNYIEANKVRITYAFEN